MRQNYLLAIYLPLFVAGILFASPLVWLAANSLKTEEEVFGSPGMKLMPSIPVPRSAGPWTDPATGETRELLLGPVRLIAKDGQEFEPGAGASISRRLRVTGPAAVSLEDIIVQDVLHYSRVNYDFTDAASFDVILTADSRMDADAFEAVQLEHQPDDSWHLLDCEVVLPDGRGYHAARSVPLAGTRRGSIQWRIPAGDEDVTRLRNWVSLTPSASRGQSGNLTVKFTVRQAGMATAGWAKVRRNFDRVVDSIPIWQYARVSIVLAILNVILSVSSSAIVAYAFARLEWPGREVCFILLLGTVLLPPQVILVPRFLIWKSIGAHDTLLPLWLPAAFGNAFFIYLLREAIRAIPRNLEDAARLDGCGTVGVFIHVVWPIVGPSLAAVATFALIGSWNDFLGPLLYISDQRLYPLSFGVFALSAHSGNDPTLVSAAALALAAPVVIIFFLLQRHVLRLSLAPAAKG